MNKKSNFDNTVYSKDFKNLSSNKKSHILREWQRYLDEISNKHSPFQKTLYMWMFWMTIGQNKKEISISYGDLRKICNIKSDCTLKKNLNYLQKIRHVEVLEKGFAIKTKYRVYSPLEIVTPDKKDKKRRK